MDKKKVKELIQEVTRNNVDNLSFGDDKHNAPLRNANGLLHDALIELAKSDWVSVEDGLPKYNEEVLVCNKKAPESIYITYRTNKEKPREVIDKNKFYHERCLKPITHWKPIEKLEE